MGVFSWFRPLLFFFGCGFLGTATRVAGVGVTGTVVEDSLGLFSLGVLVPETGGGPVDPGWGTAVVAVGK